MSYQKICESCEKSPGFSTRFGAFLCEPCAAEMEELETLRRIEEKDKIIAIAQGKFSNFQPSIAYILYLQKIKESGSAILSPERVPDFVNSNILPLLHLMSDEEIGRMLPIIKEQYFALQSAVTLRSTDRFREAEVIKKQTKVDKVRTKSSETIAKQTKQFSKDKTLSKEDRGRFKAIEGLIAMGISEEDAKRMVQAKK